MVSFEDITKNASFFIYTLFNFLIDKNTLLLYAAAPFKAQILTQIANKRNRKC
jgi:hypothetical protein